jgi:hypothetical protein
MLINSGWYVSYNHRACQIKGVVSHLADGGVSNLQYVDDTIFSMEHDLEKTRNLN